MKPSKHATSVVFQEFSAMTKLRSNFNSCTKRLRPEQQHDGECASSETSIFFVPGTGMAFVVFISEGFNCFRDHTHSDTIVAPGV